MDLTLDNAVEYRDLDGGEGGEECCEEVAHFSPRFNQIFHTVTKHSKKLLLFWLIAFVLAASVAKVFIDSAEDRLSAPAGSQAAKDRKRFDQVFPERSSEETLVLFAELEQGQRLTCTEADCLKKSCVGVDYEVSLLFERIGREITSQSKFPVNYLSYYNVSGTSFDQIKCKFASETGQATFAAFLYDPREMTKQEIYSLLHLAEHALHESLKQYKGPKLVRIGYTGVDAITKAGSDASEKQLFQVDLVTMPIALSIFACMVRSPRLLLLCVMNMLMSVVISFGLLSVVVTVLKIKPLTVEGTMTQALAVAMSIDYSLFLLRRFRDECKNGRDTALAVKIMLQQAGEVILLSCLTFQAVFVGFLFLPATDLSSLGMCAIFTLFTTLMVNLTFTTAMLTVYSDFFAKNIAVVTVAAEEMQVTVTGKKRHRRGAPYKGLYFRCMKLITTRPFNYVFIIVVYLCMLPVAWQTMRLQHNQNAMQISPKGATATKVYNAITEHFPPGILGPFSLVVVAPEYDFGRDLVFYQYAIDVTRKVAEATGVPIELFTSPVSLEGKMISFALSQRLRAGKNSLLCKTMPDLCAMYGFEWEQAVSPEGAHACIISVQLPDNPFGISGGQFVDNTRRVIDAMQKPGFELLLVSTEVDFYDDVNVAYDSLPILLITTVLVVFAIIGLGLHSAFVPLRLSLAVFIPLATVFGFAVLVYQDGALAWTGIGALEKSEDGFFYFIPIVCLMIALGLILDYDIFLVHRIVEHRTSGYDLQSSVIKAIWEVNSTINAAGLIMASVFGGLLLSDETAVDHFGFLMCSCVLVDTFVVQTFLIPPIVSMGDTFAFWPRQVPQTSLITIEDEEFKS